MFLPPGCKDSLIRTKPMFRYLHKPCAEGFPEQVLGFFAPAGVEPEYGVGVHAILFCADDEVFHLPVLKIHAALRLLFVICVCC